MLFINLYSATITGLLEKGSFKLLPVSILAFRSIVLLFCSIFKLQKLCSEFFWPVKKAKNLIIEYVTNVEIIKNKGDILKYTVLFFTKIFFESKRYQTKSTAPAKTKLTK
jgi:hypothetical protein